MNLTAAHSTNRSKGRIIVLWILQLLAAAAFLGAGGAKLAGVPDMVAMFEKIGIGQWFRYLTGALEVSGAIALLAGLRVPAISLCGALLLAMVMVGAIMSHLTILGGSPVAPIVLLVLTSMIAWLRRDSFLKSA